MKCLKNFKYVIKALESVVYQLLSANALNCHERSQSSKEMEKFRCSSKNNCHFYFINLFSGEYFEKTLRCDNLHQKCATWGWCTVVNRPQMLGVITGKTNGDFFVKLKW